MNLLAAELWRFRSRRTVRVTVIVVAVVITLGMAIAALNSTYDPASEYTTIADGCLGGPPNAEGEVDVSGCPTVVRYSSDHRVQLDALDNVLRTSGTMFLFLAVLLGATCLGAEFGAASLSTQLVYEPRRVRVWGTKALAIAIGVATIVAFATALLAGEYWAVANARGVTTDVSGAALDQDWWIGRALDGARVVGASSVGALLGFGLVGIARRTVAAVGVFIALLIAEPIVYQVSDLLDRKLPVMSLITFVLHPFDDPYFSPDDTFGFTTSGRAVLPGLLWAAALLVVGGRQFARSEIR
jgi:hypothetical protein